MTLFNLSVFSNDFNWEKTIIEGNGLSLEGATQIGTRLDTLIYIFNENSQILASLIVFENKWNLGDARTLEEDLEKLLSIYIVDNREYIHFKFNDGSQQIQVVERTDPNDFRRAKMINYPKFSFGGDTILEPNRLMKVHDSVLIAYSNRENESNLYQLHRFAISDNHFPLDYAVKGFMSGNEEFEPSKNTDHIFLKTEYEVVFNHIFICKNANKSFEVFIYPDDNNLPSDFEDLDNYQYGVNEINFKRFPFTKDDEIYDIGVDFDYLHRVIENNVEVQLILMKSYVDLKNQMTLHNKQAIIKRYYGISYSEMIEKNKIIYEFETEGEFISDFFEYKDKIIFLYKENSTGDVYTYYSNDKGENWDYVLSPELKGFEFLGLSAYNDQFYAYNENNIFITSDTKSVERKQSENNVTAFFNGNNIVVKSRYDEILSVQIIDIMGNEIINQTYNNLNELSLKTPFTNQKLLICKVVTKNEIKVIKLIKGI